MKIHNTIIVCCLFLCQALALLSNNKKPFQEPFPESEEIDLCKGQCKPLKQSVAKRVDLQYEFSLDKKTSKSKDLLDGWTIIIDLHDKKKFKDSRFSLSKTWYHAQIVHPLTAKFSATCFTPLTQVRICRSGAGRTCNFHYNLQKTLTDTITKEYSDQLALNWIKVVPGVSYTYTERHARELGVSYTFNENYECETNNGDSVQVFGSIPVQKVIAQLVNDCYCRSAGLFSSKWICRFNPYVSIEKAEFPVLGSHPDLMCLSESEARMQKQKLIRSHDVSSSFMCVDVDTPYKDGQYPAEEEENFVSGKRTKHSLPMDSDDDRGSDSGVGSGSGSSSSSTESLVSRKRRKRVTGGSAKKKIKPTRPLPAPPVSHERIVPYADAPPSTQSPGNASASDENGYMRMLPVPPTYENVPKRRRPVVDDEDEAPPRYEPNDRSTYVSMRNEGDRQDEKDEDLYDEIK